MLLVGSSEYYELQLCQRRPPLQSAVLLPRRHCLVSFGQGVEKGEKADWSSAGG